MKDITAWQKNTIPLTATQPDETAVSATLLIGLVGEEATFSKEAQFVDNLADLTITDEENVQATIPAAEYTYMVDVEYSDGSRLSFPKPGSCTDDELPKFIIKVRIEDN